MIQSTALQWAAMILLCCCGAQMIPQAEAHGFMLTPLSRNIQSFYGPLKKRDYTPHGLNAGGPGSVSAGDASWPNGKNGVCGDPYGQHKWASPATKTIYKEGSVINMDVVITAYHKGRFGFSICPYTADEAALEACLSDPSSLLLRADGVKPGEAYWYLESNGDGSNTNVPYSRQDQFLGKPKYSLTYQLPRGLLCQHCVIRWHYLTGNSCQPPCAKSDPHWKDSDPATGCDVGNLGICGTGTYPEEFWNCADIQITPDGAGSTSPSPAMSPSPLPSPSPVNSPSPPSEVVSSPPSPIAASSPPPSGDGGNGGDCNKADDASRAACFCASHPSGLHADTYSGCSGFYNCLPGGGVRQACPPGLLFDESYKYCNWPNMVTCSTQQTSSPPPEPVIISSPPSPSPVDASPPPSPAPLVLSSPPSPSPVKASPPPSPAPLVLSSPPSLSPVAASPPPSPAPLVLSSPPSLSPVAASPPPSPAADCTLSESACFCMNKPDGLFANKEAGCAGYFQCYNGGNGVYKLCPAGTLFNNKKSYCDWPHNVKCGKDPKDASPPPATSPSPTTPQASSPPPVVHSPSPAQVPSPPSPSSSPPFPSSSPPSPSSSPPSPSSTLPPSPYLFPLPSPPKVVPPHPWVRHGYVENWKQWNNEDFRDLTSVFYSFLTLDNSPNPDSPHVKGWDGKAVYETMTAEDVIKVMSEPNNSWNWKWMSNRIKGLQDWCAQNGKKFIWAVGGWSDLTKTITDEQIPSLVDKMIALLKLGGAHGIDFDWEHISEHNGPLLQQQRVIIAKTICFLRIRMNAEGLGHMEIVYTPRYNAFWQGGAYNSKSHGTDGEGIDNMGWLRDNCPVGMNAVTYINFMVYDMSATQAFKDATAEYFELHQYDKVLDSALAFGVDPSKIVIGFEPGNQAYTGVWAGMERDKAVIRHLYERGTGGVMWWAMNEDDASEAGPGMTTGKNSVVQAAYAASLA